MCTYIGSDVILANLLCYSPDVQDGVTYSDIETYCKKIKEIIAKDKTSNIRSISFGVSDPQLDVSLRVYPNYFKRFIGKYYRGIDFQMKPFEYRVDNKMKEIMKEAAENM